ESIVESKENKERESVFKRDRDQQAVLLQQASEELAAQQALGDQLKATFYENDKQLTELTETLRVLSCTLVEMFCVVRQYAG
ncbi:MotA/TolQ/ExbB proton channel family protein, partial [Vibrio parahaemolyticus]|nr:MotA/TolQ/ExbB proton channel family protein [Vibrio parahaemolyticus]